MGNTCGGCCLHHISAIRTWSDRSDAELRPQPSSESYRRRMPPLESPAPTSGRRLEVPTPTYDRSLHLRLRLSRSCSRRRAGRKSAPGRGVIPFKAGQFPAGARLPGTTILEWPSLERNRERHGNDLRSIAPQGNGRPFRVRLMFFPARSAGKWRRLTPPEGSWAASRTGASDPSAPAGHLPTLRVGRKVDEQVRKPRAMNCPNSSTERHAQGHDRPGVRPGDRRRHAAAQLDGRYPGLPDRRGGEGAGGHHGHAERHASSIRTARCMAAWRRRCSTAAWASRS